MGDDQKKQPKKFDTTSRLNLEDTFASDEITLVDELVEPDSVAETKKSEESVTERLSNQGPQWPKMAKKPATTGKSLNAGINLLDILKKAKPGSKAKRKIFIGLIGIFILIGLIFLFKR